MVDEVELVFKRQTSHKKKNKFKPGGAGQGNEVNILDLNLGKRAFNLLSGVNQGCSPLLARALQKSLG